MAWSWAHQLVVCQVRLDSGVCASHPPGVEDTRIYGGVEPADVPAYTLAEAAGLVGVPPLTLRKWTQGRSYPTRAGTRPSKAIIETPSPQFLSFTNLVEAHVLAGLRKEHCITLAKIRAAVRFVEDTFGVQHALAREQFKTDGVSLFLEKLGVLVNVSQEGQVALREVLEGHLRRVEYANGRAVRLFYRPDAPRTIVIDPRRAFGRPTLAGTSVPIVDIASRHKCGDDVEVLARDYEVSVEAVKEALLASRKAA